MFNIFVSYAQPQLPWAMHLKQMLTAPGISVYVAEHDLAAGNSLSQSIAGAIMRADLFVLLWTEAAQKSQYVGKEVFTAVTAQKSVLPLMLQAGVPLPSELGDVKYLDLSANPQAQFQWLRQDIDRRAQSKGVSNLVGAGLVAFVAWALLKGE